MQPWPVTVLAYSTKGLFVMVSMHFMSFISALVFNPSTFDTLLSTSSSTAEYLLLFFFLNVLVFQFGTAI